MDADQNNSDFYVDLLKNNSIFETTTQQSLENLVASCNLKHFIKGTHTIDKENNLYKFHFIIKGKIKVYNLNECDKHFTLFILSKNDIFDVFSLINTVQHNVCYDILEDLQLLVISTDVMREWLKNNPETLSAFFQYTMEKFKLLESQLLDVGTNTITARVANLLLQHYNKETKRIENIDNLPHDELAQLIGTSRAVINRHIQRLKKEGIIDVSRKHIKILNVKLLEAQSQTRDPFS
ncbi:Crp/Fnr family transcriptional regulator [Gelidibacter salicanalis]|uniref:Crp/Fnr family transcriptional regulator n=1 Tax=Gelidibacter salicanalis TaxID=291193 RepID=A0A5C7ATC2_9FLAO|nr:Crp/Fnr family transcriptional regulator [Gelidibacter salicanalis]TXE10843.1 Crp/Fnr family transcriptional regulator [Gelidibacter salicanalis]